jgi:hypothetical protein
VLRDAPVTAIPAPDHDGGVQPIQVGGALLVAATEQDHHAMWLLTEEHSPDECVDGLLALSEELANELASDRGTTRSAIVQALLIEAAKATD